jgi:hypothetical protein
MIAFLIQWEKFSFESPVNFSAVAGGLPEQVRGGTPYLFRMIEHEWKKLQNMSIDWLRKKDLSRESSIDNLRDSLNSFRVDSDSDSISGSR